MMERLDTRPEVVVQPAEFRRLLGYPKGHVPGERAGELAAWAADWYARHGRPWVYLRDATLQLERASLVIDGSEFVSARLQELLAVGRASRVVLVAASAGGACEAEAARLWREGKPDEYFFLETYASAVVEHLVATTSGRICAMAESTDLAVLPHYSPGYTGWDVADQPRLFELIRARQLRPFPEELRVLPGGMLQPKKAILAVFGLTSRLEHPVKSAQLIPCENCGFSPCAYRRAPYRHANGGAPSGAVAAAEPVDAAAPGTARPPLTLSARYSAPPRALEKWSRERVQLEFRDDGAVEARFRYDGTTCSNFGRPLAFEYRVVLGPAAGRFTILELDCRPASGDSGYTSMCGYLREGDALLAAVAAERPLLGRPLDDVLAWARARSPAGCYCDAESRAHKWGLALETIHYALVQAAHRALNGRETAAPAIPVSQPT